MKKLPNHTSLKEWSSVIDALGRGEHILLIRKGGIAEGRDGFRFKHPDFLLFPTLFHEQVAKLKLPPTTELPKARETAAHYAVQKINLDMMHLVVRRQFFRKFRTIPTAFQNSYQSLDSH